MSPKSLRRLKNFWRELIVLKVSQEFTRELRYYDIKNGKICTIGFTWSFWELQLLLLPVWPTWLCSWPWHLKSYPSWRWRNSICTKYKTCSCSFWLLLWVWDLSRSTALQFFLRQKANTLFIWHRLMAWYQLVTHWYSSTSTWLFFSLWWTDSSTLVKASKRRAISLGIFTYGTLSKKHLV